MPYGKMLIQYGFLLKVPNLWPGVSTDRDAYSKRFVKSQKADRINFTESSLQWPRIAAYLKFVSASFLCIPEIPQQLVLHF